MAAVVEIDRDLGEAPFDNRLPKVQVGVDESSVSLRRELRCQPRGVTKSPSTSVTGPKDPRSWKHLKRSGPTITGPLPGDQWCLESRV